MRVLIFVSVARATPHFQTDLELAEDHLAAGDEVTLLACNQSLELCEHNGDRKRARCVQCVGLQRDGVRQLVRRPRLLSLGSFLTEEDRRRTASFPVDFDSTEALQALRFEGLDLGYAVASSLVTLERDPEPDWSQHRDALGRYLRTAARVYLAARNYLKREGTDRAYAFNGRFATVRGAIRACQEMGVEYFTHERGAKGDLYALHRNALPHDIAHVDREIRAAWSDPAVSRATKEEVARAWFHGRARGADVGQITFTARQVQGRLPEGWRDDRRNVALFCSSDYEYASIGDEWRNPLFPRPSEGVVRIASALANSGGDLHLTIRMHPNLARCEGPSAERIRVIEGEHVTVVPPESPVCSYALLRASEKVVTTTSTVGIEAAFWGRPSIQAGRSLHTHLGATYLPRSFEELIELIERPDLEPLPPEGALMYGYYLATFGRPFRHFTSEGTHAGRFKGRRLRPDALHRLRMEWWRTLYHLSPRAGTRPPVP